MPNNFGRSYPQLSSLKRYELFKKRSKMNMEIHYGTVGVIEDLGTYKVTLDHTDIEVKAVIRGSSGASFGDRNSLSGEVKDPTKFCGHLMKLPEGARVIVAFVNGSDDDPIIIAHLLDTSAQEVIDAIDAGDFYYDVPRAFSNKFGQSRIGFETATGDILVEHYFDRNGKVHTIRLSEDKIEMNDNNGNTFSMESGKIVINGNVEILQ